MWSFVSAFVVTIKDNSFWAQITYKYNDPSFFNIFCLSVFVIVTAVMYFNCQTGQKKTSHGIGAEKSKICIENIDRIDK